jgi:hypothetical protein
MAKQVNEQSNGMFFGEYVLRFASGSAMPSGSLAPSYQQEARDPL